MSQRQGNRFIYATLIDLGFDPENPEILLELGTEHPVDWDAVDAEGAVICKRLDFVLTVDHVKIGGEPLGIHFVYDRVVRDFGHHGHAHIYVLGMRPSRTRDGRDSDSDQDALETVVDESRHVRRRSWCTDIGEVRIRWRHNPQDFIRLPNGAFEPEATGEAPRATEDEVANLCDAFDAICDELDRAPPAPTIVAPSEYDDAGSSSPGIPLSDEDIEDVVDHAFVEMPAPKSAEEAA